MDENIEKRVLTVKEVQVLLGIGRNKAYALCNGNQFRVVKVGATILVPKKGFNDWLNGSEE